MKLTKRHLVPVLLTVAACGYTVWAFAHRPQPGAPTPLALRDLPEEQQVAALQGELVAYRKDDGVIQAIADIEHDLGVCWTRMRNVFEPDRFHIGCVPREVTLRIPDLAVLQHSGVKAVVHGTRGLVQFVLDQLRNEHHELGYACLLSNDARTRYEQELRKLVVSSVSVAALHRRADAGTQAPLDAPAVQHLLDDAGLGLDQRYQLNDKPDEPAVSLTLL